MPSKNEKRMRLKRKIRAKVSGTGERPRLSVYRSNSFIYAQVVDDLSGKTLAQANDLKISGKKSERAGQVGALIAEACKKAKISRVIFDRNGFRYTGRVKILAEAARVAGLEF